VRRVRACVRWATRPHRSTTYILRTYPNRSTCVLMHGHNCGVHTHARTQAEARPRPRPRAACTSCVRVRRRRHNRARSARVSSRPVSRHTSGHKAAEVAHHVQHGSIERQCKQASKHKHACVFVSDRSKYLQGHGPRRVRLFVRALRYSCAPPSD
jgi:hypothetical protein